MRFPMLGAAVAALLPAVAVAQPLNNPFQIESYVTDSGFLHNPTNESRVIYQHTVYRPGAEWLQLQFETTNLPPGTRLRLQAKKDGAVQWFDGGSLRDYANGSAYFNGDTVTVELFAAPGSRANRVQLSQLRVGMPFADDTICGPTDDRLPSDDPRQGRQWPSGCTVYMVSASAVVTAGHCATRTQQIHCNVPFSTSTGALRLPPPKDQYPYDGPTLRQLSAGIGSDWAVVSTVRNSNTGLYVGQAQGSWYNVGQVPTQTGGQTIRITGYGTTSGGVPRTWNQVQKTHTGPLFQINSTSLDYRTDTTGGNSGSPVIHENTGSVIGVHTHGGCTNSGGSNHGTRIDRNDFSTAIVDIINLHTVGFFEQYGLACTGTAGTPELSMTGFPELTTQVSIDVNGVVANQLGALWFGASDQIWNGTPLPFSLAGLGMPGCALLASIDVVVPLATGANGTPSFAFAIPNVSTLIGQEFFNQYASADPGANALGMTTTNGGRSTVGE